MESNLRGSLLRLHLLVSYHSARSNTEYGFECPEGCAYPSFIFDDKCDLEQLT